MDALVLLRHAEKPDAATAGVDEAGRPDAHALSVRGWQRAGALVPWLAPADAPPRFGRPAGLWAAPATAAHPSHRPADTLQPLARALGLAVRVDVDPDDAGAAAARLAAAPGTVIAAWRHQALPPLARAVAAALGGAAVPARAADAIPLAWPADRFDVAWIFERDAGGAWRFRQVPQRLLAGDGDAGIAVAPPRSP